MGASRCAPPRDFEDTVAWLAQQMAFTPITRLLRVGWRTVGAIVERVVGDHLDEDRLEELVCIGVDEISYRRRHRYLTSVADHASGAIVWCQPGRNSATLQGFFDELGDRKDSIRAVSIDMSGEYQRAIRATFPPRRSALTPYTSSASAHGDRPGPPRRMEPPRALAHAQGPLGQGHPLVAAQGARAPEHLPARHARRGPDREPSGLPRLPAARRAAAALPPARPDARAAHLDAWLAWASRSRLRPFARLARTLAKTAKASSPPSSWALKRRPRGPELEDPPDQPPRLRLPLRRPPSSRSSTSAAQASRSTSRDELHPQLDRSAGKPAWICGSSLGKGCPWRPGYARNAHDATGEAEGLRARTLASPSEARQRPLRVEPAQRMTTITPARRCVGRRALNVRVVHVELISCAQRRRSRLRLAARGVTFPTDLSVGPGVRLDPVGVGR